MTVTEDTATLAWRSKAACLGKVTALWFPEGRDSGAEAIAICSTCPVGVECLEYGLRYETTGIFGGATERERQAIRAQRRIVVRRPEKAFYASERELQAKRERRKIEFEIGGW